MAKAKIAAIFKKTSISNVDKIISKLEQQQYAEAEELLQTVIDPFTVADYQRIIDTVAKHQFEEHMEWRKYTMLATLLEHAEKLPPSACITVHKSIDFLRQKTLPITSADTPSTSYSKELSYYRRLFLEKMLEEELSIFVSGCVNRWQDKLLVQDKVNLLNAMVKSQADLWILCGVIEIFGGKTNESKQIIIEEILARMQQDSPAISAQLASRVIERWQKSLTTSQATSMLECVWQNSEFRDSNTLAVLALKATGLTPQRKLAIVNHLQEVGNEGEACRLLKAWKDPFDTDSVFKILKVAVKHQATKVLNYVFSSELDKHVTSLEIGMLLLHSKYRSINKFLLQRGAELNVANSEWETPLHCTLKNGDLETARRLVSNYGMNIYDKNNKGETALSYAPESLQVELINRYTKFVIIESIYRTILPVKENINKGKLYSDSSVAEIFIKHIRKKLPSSLIDKAIEESSKLAVQLKQNLLADQSKQVDASKLAFQLYKSVFSQTSHFKRSAEESKHSYTEMVKSSRSNQEKEGFSRG
jgi:hypothetical protein